MLKSLFKKKRCESVTNPEPQNQEWPYDQGKNVACITVKAIMEDISPILVVVHDAEDYGWQFLCGREVSTEDARVVSMENIVAMDPSVLEVGRIPPGHQAWRKTKSSAWKVSKC